MYLVYDTITALTGGVARMATFSNHDFIRKKRPSKSLRINFVINLVRDRTATVEHVSQPKAENNLA